MFIIDFFKDLYWTILDRNFQKKYKEQKVPIFLPKYGLWIVNTTHGLEYMTSISYIASEFLELPGSGLIYHYKDSLKNAPDHEHTFEGILGHLIDDPKNFSINGYYEEYSEQEICFLRDLKSKLLDLQK